MGLDFIAQSLLKPLLSSGSSEKFLMPWLSQNGHWKSTAIPPAGKIPDSYFAPVFFFFFTLGGWNYLAGEKFFPSWWREGCNQQLKRPGSRWGRKILAIYVSSWGSGPDLGAEAECCSDSSGTLTRGPTAHRGSQIPIASSGLRLGRGPTAAYPALHQLPTLPCIMFPGCTLSFPSDLCREVRLLGSLVPPLP